MSVSSGWVAAGIAALVMLGTGSAAYTDVKSEVAVLDSQQRAIVTVEGKLDEYDAYLSREIDILKERTTKTESVQVSLKATQDRIDGTMREILNEMKDMNENIIKLGVKNGNK